MQRLLYFTKYLKFKGALCMQTVVFIQPNVHEHVYTQRFEQTIYPKMQVVQEDATHLVAFLHREIGLDSFFLKNNMRAYKDDSTIFLSIKWIRSMKAHTNYSTLFTDFFVGLCLLPLPLQEQVRAEIRSITERETETYVNQVCTSTVSWCGAATGVFAQWVAAILKTMPEDSKATPATYCNNYIQTMMKKEDKQPNPIYGILAQANWTSVKKSIEQIVVISELSAEGQNRTAHVDWVATVQSWQQDQVNAQQI